MAMQDVADFGGHAIVWAIVFTYGGMTIYRSWVNGPFLHLTNGQ